jgi:hypothetical protein
MQKIVTPHLVLPSPLRAWHQHFRLVEDVLCRLLRACRGVEPEVTSPAPSAYHSAVKSALMNCLLTEIGP